MALCFLLFFVIVMICLMVVWWYVHTKGFDINHTEIIVKKKIETFKKHKNLSFHVFLNDFNLKILWLYYDYGFFVCLYDFWCFWWYFENVLLCFVVFNEFSYLLNIVLDHLFLRFRWCLWCLMVFTISL